MLVRFRVPPRVVRIVLIATVAIGVIVDGFFAIVNFYPVAPHPNRGPRRYVVMQLDSVQAAWFQANVLDDFNTEENANLQLIAVDEEEALQSAAAEAEKHGKDVVLVALPRTQVAAAVASKLVRPFAGLVGASRIASDFHRLGDDLLARGQFGGSQYFLPRMTVLDVAVYRVSKVRDAVLHWSVLRPQINAALAKINGRGLPAGYDLGLSPSWSAYDVFVMAYYWANRSYGGEPARPRVVHRSGDEIDGQQDIAAGSYRMGETDATFGKPDSRAALDYFQWEALYRAEGLYPEAVYGDEPFDDEAVIAGLESGEVYLAPLDSMEAFNLHGGAHVGAEPEIDDPADLEFAALPRGASLALDADGHPQRSGPSFSFREDWVWALPAAADAPLVGYRLARFLWRPEIHARECEALGMLPLEPSVVAERVSRFRLDWMSHVFGAGLAQHSEPVPPSLVGKGVGSVYAQLWARIVGGSVPPAPESGIAAILAAPPPPTPLAVVVAGAAAAPEEPAAPRPEALTHFDDDWETDVVIQPHVAAAGTGSGSGSR